MNYLERDKNLELFRKISKALPPTGPSLFVVGGYVRDIFLGRNESKNVDDIDFVTESSGPEVAKMIHQSLSPKSKLSLFKTYGTAHFRYQNIDLEFVGARKESYKHDSRNPIVSPGTLDDDLSRRDFTINAMAISLNSEDFGALIDPFNGREDIENRVLRTPLEPEVTYSDDPLRMMRAIRFASVLNFNIHPDSYTAIVKNADRIKIISMERVMVEFEKILLSAKPSVGISLLEKTGLLKHILPELLALKGIEEIEGQSHKDNFYHTLEVVDNISKHTDSLYLRWAALLHDIGKADTKKFLPGTGWTFHGHEFLGFKMIPGIFKRLKLPLGSDMKYVAKLVKLSSRPIALVTEEATDSSLRRLVVDAGEDLDDLFTLCKADITTKNERKQRKYQENFDLVYTKIKEVEERDQLKNFQPPVSGEDLMAWFSLQPGKEIGILKSQVKEAILEGDIPNEPEAAKEFVFEKAKELGLVPA